ncbi:MAG: AAA domain-containing protein [Actinomycetota bacterium]
MARYNVSPSRIARYYFHECDRYLRYSATPTAFKEQEGVPPDELDHSLLTKAILDSGFVWEREVLENHIKESRVLGPLLEGEDEPEPAITKRVHTVGQTIDALRNAAAGQFIYQPTLAAPERFYQRYGLDPELVGFSDCRPDLLMITPPKQDGPLEVTVLDLKATDEAKLSHRIQATLYTLILQSVIDDLGIDHLTTTREGGVWLYQKDDPELFDLSGVRPPLEHFLRNELQPILLAPASKAFWHLFYRCEWCDFYKHCRAEAEATDDVSLVPYLSTFAKRHLAQAAKVETMGDLEELLKDENRDEILTGSASLRGKARRLALSIDAIRTGVEHPTDASSVAMPIGENVRIIVSVQSEPLQGSIYAYAISRFGGGPSKTASEPHIFDEWNDVVSRVSPTADEQDVAELRHNFVKDMMAILRPVHDFNVQYPSFEEWKLRKSVQVYVFDTYERELLVSLLLDATHDPDPQIAEDALALFFHFQHPDLVAADDHPANEVFFPVVVLISVIRSVFALPIKVAYAFADVVACLQPSEFGFTYEVHPYFDFEISNRLKSDAIFNAWFKGDTERLDWITSRLVQRVRATNSIINGLRERLKGSSALFAWPPKFALPAGADFKHPLLSRLAFVTRYEVVLGFLDKRSRRAAAEPERLANGDTFRLTHMGDGRYRIDPSQVELDLDSSGFHDWFLTTDTDGGRRARFAFDDFAYRKKHWAPKQLDMALAKVSARDGDVLTIDLKKTEAFVPPQEGQVTFLEERFKDPMSDFLLAELAQMDQQDDPWLVRLLADPVSARKQLSVAPSIMLVASELAGRSGLMPSQMDALNGILGHDLQLVWGPPGTGKTHFLAVTILAMAEAHRREGLEFRVLVTGFTNQAIDNALRKIVDVQNTSSIYGGALEVRKMLVAGNSPVETLNPKKGAEFISNEQIVVIGATVWQARKVTPDEVRYDMVVVDEGSQLEVAETAIAVRRLRDGKRLLIAGDDKQLPPIVQGNYRIPEGEPLIHRSILEALRERDPDHVTVATLLENFRMNDVLCEYPRNSIYPAEYGPATPAIAARRLQLNGYRRNGLISQLLDPTHPMVMHVMDVVRSGPENPEEAALVAAVACRYRELLDCDDEEFWSKRLFIVSPHHAQIRAIRRDLHRRRSWESEPFVDTVDKMQGQECDMVIVSYGVADPEYALMEREFIYSRNRLNVAITRARMKTVVILSRSLLEPPLQALDRDDVAEGVAFMQGLTHSVLVNEI